MTTDHCSVLPLIIPSLSLCTTEKSVLSYCEFRVNFLMIISMLDVCMVFEVLGQNLLALIIKSNYRGIHIDNVRLIMRQVIPASITRRMSL